MKRFILSIAACLLFASAAEAQKVWCDPVVYVPDEEVTWYVDLSDLMKTEGEAVYIWSWAPSNPEEVHHPGEDNIFGDNPTEELSRLNYEGSGIYSITITPTEWYGKTAEELYAAGTDIFWFNLRRPDGAGGMDWFSGSLQAPRPFLVELPAFEAMGTDVKIYPTSFTYKTPVSLLFNLEQVNAGGIGGFLEEGYQFESLHLHSGCNEFADHLVEFQVWVPERVEATRLKKISDKIYKFDMTSPADYFGITDEELDNGYVFSNFEFVVAAYVNGDWGKVGTTQSGANFRFYSADVEPDPDPSFSYFPSKISAGDILTLTREYDDYAAGLEYTITVGNTTLTGEFTGSRSKRVATVNLFDGLKNESAAAKIHLVVTRADSGATVEEMDIPLVTVDVE